MQARVYDDDWLVSAVERHVVANYTKRIAQAEAFGDKGLAIRLEDMLAEETDHAEDLERLGR